MSHKIEIHIASGEIRSETILLGNRHSNTYNYCMESFRNCERLQRYLIAAGRFSRFRQPVFPGAGKRSVRIRALLDTRAAGGAGGPATADL